MWESGTHGHIRFRPYMREDWIISVILLLCFGVPLMFFLAWLKNRNRASKKVPGDDHS